MRDFRLYLILDADISSSRGDIVEIAHQAAAGGADILQLRAKDLPQEQIEKAGRGIRELTQQNQALFVINDRPDLVEILNADGAHLGQEDSPIQEARRILGNNKIIGISTHSLEQAEKAEAKGADYISLGPIFTTATKPNLSAVTPELITKVKDKVKIPFVAIGGITLNNLDQVLNAGAQRVAVCGAIIEAKDIFKATQEFKQRLK